MSPPSQKSSNEGSDENDDDEVGFPPCAIACLLVRDSEERCDEGSQMIKRSAPAHAQRIHQAANVC